MSGPKMEKPGEAAMSAVSAISDRTRYSIAKRRNNIVDMVLKIIDGEGPKPMKNMRPAQKNRTGADQFDDDHHGEYEARGEPSRDKIGRVHTHNSAFPKMYDELNKRRSTAQPAAYIANPNISMPTNFDPNCRICVKLKNRSELDTRKKRISKRPRQRKSYRLKSNNTRNSKRAVKAKRSRRSQSPSKTFQLARIRTNKGCQCSNSCAPAETKSVSTFNDNFVSVPLVPEVIVPLAPNLGSHDILETKSVKVPVQQKASKKSDVDSGNPETNSNPSVSSYNSFMSMEHEPMVE